MHFNLRKTMPVVGAVAVTAALAGGITGAWASDGAGHERAPGGATPGQAVALPTVDHLPAGAVPADTATAAAGR